MNEKPATVEEYLATLEPAARDALEALRRLLRALAPATTETMSYAMPTLRYRDRVLVHFAAWKHHLALYGLDVAGHAELLAPYDTDKGTIRFPQDLLPPVDLLATLINARMVAIDTARDTKKARKPA